MGVTYEDVAGAAERLTAAGRRPSVSAVRTELGTGSMSTITPLLRQWRANQEITEASNAYVSGSLINALKQVLEKEIRERIQAATAELQAESEGKEADLAACAKELAKKDVVIADLAKERDELKSAVAKVEGSLSEVQRQTESVRSQLAAAVDQANEKSRECTALQEKLVAADKALLNASMLHSRIAEQDKRIAELEARNEILHRDAEDLRRLQKDLPTLQSKADRFDDLCARNKDAEAKINSLQETMQKLNGQLACASAEIAEARAKAETAEALKNAVQQQIQDLLADKKELSEQIRNLREKKAESSDVQRRKKKVAEDVKP